MDVLRTEGFEEQSRRFSLRFTCEACVFFQPAAQRCLHGWPTEAHRAVRYATAPRPGDVVTFCKEFEAD